MRKKIILISYAILLLVGFIYAYSEETAETHSYYAHPVTGIIEDSGNNPELGSGMCRNVLHEYALFEEIDSEIYTSIRYNLAEHISDVGFFYQLKESEEFIPIDYEIVKSTEDTTDFRFKLPTKDVLIRSSFFVKPMGRNIVFYFDFSDFVSGNTDFTPLGQNGKIGDLIKSSDLQKINSVDSININSMNSIISSGEIGYDHGLLTKDSPQIKAINNLTSSSEDFNEERKPGNENRTNYEELGPISSSVINALMIFIILITFFFSALAIVLYIMAKLVKEKNLIMEDMLGEED